MAGDTRTAPWRVEQGEREVMTFSVLNPDGTTFPLTGWTVDARIRDCPGGPDLHTFPPADITVDTLASTIELVIPAPVSAGWGWRRGWYRVQITDPATDPADPETYRILQGLVVIDPD